MSWDARFPVRSPRNSQKASVRTRRDFEAEIDTVSSRTHGIGLARPNTSVSGNRSSKAIIGWDFPGLRAIEFIERDFFFSSSESTFEPRLSSPMPSAVIPSLRAFSYRQMPRRRWTADFRLLPGNSKFDATRHSRGGNARGWQTPPALIHRRFGMGAARTARTNSLNCRNESLCPEVPEFRADRRDSPSPKS